MIQWIKNRVDSAHSLADALLVRKVRMGDRDAFGKLYMKYLDPLYRFVYYRVGQDKNTAEDLTEIIFFKAWKHIHTLTDNTANIRAWLYAIARNTIIDYFRTHTVHTSSLDESIDIPSGEKSLEEKIDEKLTMEKIKKEIRRLTPIQQEVVILRFIEDLTSYEIGQILHKDESAVRAIQYRAIQELRKLLNKQNSHSGNPALAGASRIRVR